LLTGSIDDISPPEIFTVLGKTQKTGVFRANSRNGSALAAFLNGDVVHAATSSREGGLGKRLVAAGALTPGQLARAIENTAPSGEDLGLYLSRHGFITQEELSWALRREIEESVAELFAWREGDFTFQPGERLGIEAFSPVPIEELLTAHRRGAEELERIRRDIPSTAIYVLARALPSANKATISAEEWRLLAQLDGRNDVEEVVTSSRLPELRAMRLLRDLAGRGLVELRTNPATERLIDLRDRQRVGRAPAPPPPPPAVRDGS
jgi:hypothetical protein